MLIAVILATAAPKKAPADKTVATLVPPIRHFDLAEIPKHKRTCADRDAGDDIVVCAPKAMAIFVDHPEQFVEKPVRPEFVGPLNSTTTLHVIQHGSPAGTAPAAAITFSWHF